MANEMHVAGLSVPAGRVVRHALEVTELADGCRIMLPLLLINGAFPKSPLDQMPIDPWTSSPDHAEGNITERLAGRGREIDK